MRLAFVLYKYFPYGGLQRDCMKVVRECLCRGHDVDIYCLEWSGPKPEGARVEVVQNRELRNYRRYELFAEHVGRQVQQQGYDGVIGFNRMPGLDLYFGADPCFALKCEQRSSWNRLLPRTKSFLRSEEAVYAQNSSTQIMLLSEMEVPDIQRIYGTERERLHLLPPGVAEDRLAPPDYAEQRARFREELGVSDEQKLLLMVGSGFRVKGVDRAIDALAGLPESLRSKSKLMILGRDNSRPFERYAHKLGLAEKVRFLGGRDDVQKFLFAADLLVHPAHRESAGMVLLEAVAANLPVLVTDTCGYSFHIQDSGVGKVHQSPFDIKRFTSELTNLLNCGTNWSALSAAYLAKTDIFGLASKATDLIERTLQ